MSTHPPRNPYKDRFEVNIRFKIEPNGGAVDGGGCRTVSGEAECSGGKSISASFNLASWSSFKPNPHVTFTSASFIQIKVNRGKDK